MIIDKRGKLFGKISIIDLLILLLLVVVAGFGYKYMSSRGAGQEASQTEKFVIVFYGEEAPEFAVKAVKVGDVARDLQGGTVFGSIVQDVKAEKPKKFIDNEKGETVALARDGYVSYFMTVEGEGVIRDTGIAIGGSEFQMGKTLTIKVGSAIFQGMIYSIEKKG